MACIYAYIFTTTPHVKRCFNFSTYMDNLDKSLKSLPVDLCAGTFFNA